MSIYKNGTLEICTVGICKNMCDYCGQANLIKSYRSRGIDVSIQNNLQMSFDTFKLCIKSEEYNRIIQGLHGDESIPILCRSCDMSVHQ